MSQQVNPAAGAASSTGELVQQLTQQMSHLVRDEMKLAQAEMTRKGKGVASGVGIFGGSGIVALYGTGCLLAAAVAGLATALATWLAALIVGVVLFAIAGIAALIGKRQLSKATPLVPEHTVQSVKTDAEVISERARQ